MIHVFSAAQAVLAANAGAAYCSPSIGRVDDLGADAARATRLAEVVEQYDGHATVAACTVVPERSGAARTVIVAETAGGAFAGHQTEKYVRAEKQSQVTVRFEDGSTRTLAQEGGNRWQVGDRVRLGNGSLLPN